MNNLGRTLLILGLVVLALLVGILVGRGQRGQPAAAGNATVQITTMPTAPTPPPTPLPALPPLPQPAAIPKIAPEAQVQEDAAAVGMTTREGSEADQPPQEPQHQAPVRTTTSDGEPSPPPTPIG